jgi:hypothetical protein
MLLRIEELDSVQRCVQLFERCWHNAPLDLKAHNVDAPQRVAKRVRLQAPC